MSKTILCFGDSLTAGYGMQRGQSYPELLQEHINNDGYNYQVINAGVSGDTTHDGLRRLSYHLSQPIDIFILELGVNDMIRGGIPDQIKVNLSKILNQVIEQYPNCKLVVAGMQLPPVVQHPFISRFTNIYDSLANQYKALLIPSFLDGVIGMPALNLPDRLHPNAQGYQIIARNVYEQIKGLL